MQPLRFVKELAAILCGISICVSFFPPHAWAISFDPNSIISDADFFRSDDMTVADVQNFLERKNSTLSTYQAKDGDGALKTASEIIARAARSNGINPKVLLVLLQKEQSLIENPQPTQYNYDWATGFARCDSCSATDPNVAAYKGFVSQVEKAAWRKVYYTTHFPSFNFRPGLQKIIDGLPVTPRNAATAALYNYTPHLRGNFSFWKLWVRYFERFYPDGTILQAKGSKDIWLIHNNQKRKFRTMGTFLSRESVAKILTVTPEDLLKYESGLPILFPQYSLLRSRAGAVFLVVDERKYGIPSKKIFRSLGFNPEEIISANDDDLASLETAGLITARSTDPRGELVQDPRGGGVYFIQEGVRHPILERAVLKTNFPYQKIARGKVADIDTLPVGTPVVFENGVLVRGAEQTAVYMISNGEKRAFTSSEVFESLGFKWTDIVASSGSTLENHPDGEPIDLGRAIPDSFQEAFQIASTK